MKTLIEFITIKNLNTEAVTTVDDEGNIESQQATGHGVRPDGTPDGLDDLLDGEFADFGDFDEMATDAEVTDDLGGPTDELSPEYGAEGELDDEFGATLDGEIGETPEDEGDPDFQGVIRTVTGACLVYKRKGEEGTFEELWMFNVGKNMRGEVKIRRAVLAGTDIQPQGLSSEDGTQNVETTTIGNVQFLRITGLPN